MNQDQIIIEFDRQVESLLQKGYPEAAGLTAQQFLDITSSLRIVASRLIEAPDVDLEQGLLPFAIIVKSSLVSAEDAMSLVQRDGKQGVTILRPHTSHNFKPIDNIKIPEDEIYLLVNIDRGKTNINLPPNEALKLIEKDDRSPLTIEEGIALVTHFPEFLIKNNCFSLLASRTGQDQRVPAIWINANKQPNLGWCWDGNPHTWLGSASGKARVGSSTNPNT